MVKLDDPGAEKPPEERGSAMKTTYKHDWKNGYTKRRVLSRSFRTLEEAKLFAAGKLNAEIYVSKGLYKVEWLKITDNNG